MCDLWNTFIGYIKISYPRIPWVILFALLFYVVFELLEKFSCIEFKYIKGKKWLSQGALGVSCSLVFVLSLFGRQQAEYGMSLVPFESYVSAFKNNNPEVILQHIMNVVIYIPLGFLLPCCFKSVETWKRVLVSVVICSAGIELVQLFAKIGYLETDDILNNVVGAAIGWLLWLVLIEKNDTDTGNKK